MRIYVLLTSVKPIEAFLYKEGFARMSTEPFTLDVNTLKNNFIHLTNYAINKHNVTQTTQQNYIGGSKITLKMLQEKLKQSNLSWEKVWEQVKDIVMKSLIATS
jgi:phosphoenolpyruvate carboxylase